MAELVIAISGAVISVGGFIITAGIMLKSNKQGFEALGISSKTGFDMVEIKFSNLIQVLALERDGMKKDIANLDEDISGIKDQLKSEIYPRLNTVEQDSKKNCRALLDFKDLCIERHKNIKAS